MNEILSEMDKALLDDAVKLGGHDNPEAAIKRALQEYVSNCREQRVTSYINARQISLDAIGMEDIRISNILVLYHRRGWSYKDIAQRLNLSPSGITRLLEKAKKRRLVSTMVRLPVNRIYGGELVSLFPPEVIEPHAVVTAQPHDGVGLNAIGIAASRYFGLVGRDNIKVATGGGETVSHMIEELQPGFFTGIHVYPVAGGPPYDPYASVYSLIGRFYAKYGGIGSGFRAHSLPPPLTGSADEKLMTPEVGRTMQEASEADIFLLGVGSLKGSRDSTLNQMFDYMTIDMQSIIDNGGVGDCGFSAFDADGRLVPSELDHRVYKVPWESFGTAARTPGKRVILMGQGTEKAEPIYALLKAGCCNSLITDEPTAKEILTLADRSV